MPSKLVTTNTQVPRFQGFCTTEYVPSVILYLVSTKTQNTSTILYITCKKYCKSFYTSTTLYIACNKYCESFPRPVSEFGGIVSCIPSTREPRTVVSVHAVKKNLNFSGIRILGWESVVYQVGNIGKKIILGGIGKIGQKLVLGLVSTVDQHVPGGKFLELQLQYHLYAHGKICSRAHQNNLLEATVSQEFYYCNLPMVKMKIPKLLQIKITVLTLPKLQHTLCVNISLVSWRKQEEKVQESFFSLEMKRSMCKDVWR